MCQKFEAAVRSDEARAAIVCTFLSICSQLDYKPEKLIKTCKRHFIRNPSMYSPLEVLRFLTALRVLDALDDFEMEAVGRTAFAAIPVVQHSLEDRRNLCKVLMTLRILNNKVNVPSGRRAEWSRVRSFRKRRDLCRTSWRRCVMLHGGLSRGDKEPIKLRIRSLVF